ncbi:MAG: sigma-70 family RNA polymerase sigma factor [Thermoleophilia bacterium]|nr:sigma-70 family RNA polymerase sigma factor [Thermoleophilia bacterium]
MGQTEEAPPKPGRLGRVDRHEAGNDLAQRKRAAVELIHRHDTALRSSARRYSICADDADDAYQRGIEILLSKAPTIDVRQLLPWARTVIKHEALAIRKSRERTLGRPASAYREDESEDWVNLIPSASDGPDERTVKREKVARSREALSRLKPHELKALTMLAEGYSYAEIADINRWTRTKVNRCLAEGRQRFRSVFSDSEAGELCAEFEPQISACCDGEIASDQLSQLQDHLATCGHCRATLRAYRAVPRAAAALLPLAPASQTLWERIQEVVVTAQLKLQGLGRGSDPSMTSVAASGGTRGAGAAALAKVATICVGTAGGAAACVATGVIPVPEILPNHNQRPAISRPADRPQPAMASKPDPARLPEASSAEAGNSSPQPAKQVKTSEQVQNGAPAPDPTPTEAEFTPEVAGTAVTSSAPAPPAPTTSSVPVGGGGGEFGP